MKNDTLFRLGRTNSVRGRRLCLLGGMPFTGGSVPIRKLGEAYTGRSGDMETLLRLGLAKVNHGEGRQPAYRMTFRGLMIIAQARRLGLVQVVDKNDVQK